jgi:DNA repair exonuclease SbcCD ATPase subunit
MNLPANENLINAEQRLKKASSDNIIELCEKYLQSLREYRDELYKFRGTPEIDLRQSSPAARETIEQKRNAIRTELEIITRKRNETEALLESFTSINGYEAVKTFNRLEYKGFTSWELRANEVRPQNDDNNERMKIQEAVETASLLRREAYVAYQVTFPR